MRQLPLPKQTRPTHHTHTSWKRRLLIAGGAMLAVCIVINIGMVIAYWGRVLPNYRLGSLQVGGKKYVELQQANLQDTLLPSRITFGSDSKTMTVPAQDLGFSVDKARSIEQLKNARTWLPITSLVRTHKVPVVMTADTNTFTAATAKVIEEFSYPAKANHVVFTNTAFTVAPAQQGKRVVPADLQGAVQSALEQGWRTVAVPTRIVKAPTETDLSPELKRLQKQLQATIQVQYAGKRQKFTVQDMGAWYVAEGQTMIPSEERIRTQIERVAQGFGATARNTNEIVQATLYALHKSTTVDLQLVSSTSTKVHRYCIAQRGLTDSVLPELRQKVAATFNDVRGWNNSGRVAFVYATSGCDFTVWLSAPSHMTSFGAICDSYYSCNVSPNVVVNYDRWQTATDPWNKASLGIEDYRAMAINHETGHWLGFDHTTCPAAGQPAPLMMQQSIELGGCKFNAWPLPSEVAAVQQ